MGDLNEITDANPKVLQGEVQCIDSISGCLATLYQMQVLESSGEIYDEFLFTQGMPRERARVLGSFVSRPPKVLIVSSILFPTGPDDYGKLSMWPEFNTWLGQNYQLLRQRTMTPVQSVGRRVVPPGYRLYVLR
jgi:hypothetical protein